MDSRELVRRAIEFQGPSRIPLRYSFDPERSDIVGIGYHPAKGWMPQVPGEDEFGCVWDTLEGRVISSFGQVKDSPIRSWDEYENYRFPDPHAEGRFERLAKEVENYRSKGKYIVGGMGFHGFNRMMFLRGAENLLMDLVLNQGMVKKLADDLMQWEMAIISGYLKLGVDGIWFGDDWGTQRGLFISPSLWREIFKPLYKAQFDLIHQHGKHVLFHSKVKRYSALARREALTFYGFISPWLIGFLAFTGGPILASLYFSLTKYTALARPEFTGFGNFLALFKDPLFWKSLYNTFYYTMFFVPLGIVTAFLLALLLNQKVTGLAVYRTVYYLPSIVPAVANSVLWIWLLNPQWGLINLALKTVGIQGPGWLTSEQWSKPGIILMSLWGIGSWVIIYLAGLQGVPEQLYEAAEVDGATKFRRFIHITVPLMTPTIFFTLITGTIGAFQVFTQAYIMTNGGPVNSTLFYALYLFQNAFNYLKMGYAAAMAWILFVIILILTLVQFRLARRWVFYE